MATAAETRGELRFACTQCGACCNRSPEVALSEAAALSDVFVFRLMFRLYELPRTGSGEEFYESKRLLAAFAARKYSTKRRQAGKPVEYASYLTISALALDTGAGACAALIEGRCGIYERRPAACRTVPFHYSRPEASAEREFKAFVATPGYGCDTTAAAPIVVAAGRILDPEARRARSDAIERAGRDRRWEEAILRRLKTGAGDDALPSLREIEANAPFGATTVSMRIAWQIAAETGAIGAETCRTLIAAQAAVIDRELASARCTSSARETLGEMRGEYRALLNG
ncbi:MAG TPA: YkgJ family cysteine cluster protein [Allosphingosinicella sp.]|nr:YkgJ family cysteine cluster protein [Allosphingosinicella sp.]